MPYLSCPRCRLTIYTAVAYAYPTSDTCPRCSASLGGQPKRLLGWRRAHADGRPLSASTGAPR